MRKFFMFEIMESIYIPHNNVPCKNITYKFGYSMTSITYLNIILNSNNSSKGNILKLECKYQLFSILAGKKLFIFSLYIPQHRYCISNIPLFFHLTWWFLQIYIDVHSFFDTIYVSTMYPSWHTMLLDLASKLILIS